MLNETKFRRKWTNFFCGGNCVEFRLWHGYCLLLLFRFVMRKERHEHCAVDRERGVGMLKVTDKEGANREPVIVEEIGTIKEKPHVLC